jgi:hypothetical protein
VTTHLAGRLRHPFHALWLLVPLLLPLVLADRAVAVDGESTRVLSRLFFQDESEAALYWCDVAGSDGGQLDEPHLIEGFPKLDPQTQSLVQMRAVDHWLMVGVRDREDGELQSGWVLIDTGVRADEHGDHVDWNYARPPRVRASVLDENQGNPAHLYVYDGVFYLANDRRNGFTRLDPGAITADLSASQVASLASFHRAGGGHITLAADEDLALATWLDREGDNRGRVDVVRFAGPESGDPLRSLYLDEGGLHGATACCGKAFFAPAAGIHWVAIDAALCDPQAEVEVAQLDLGQDGDTPRRTGSFAVHGTHVLFVTGRGETTTLGIIDASGATPTLHTVDSAVDEQSRAIGPVVVTPYGQSPVAFLFHDHPLDADAPHVASLIRLDPNRDGRCDDACFEKQLEIGRSAVVGHAGHHDMAAVTAADRAWITNPGDGTISQLRLRKLAVHRTFQVGGAPGRILAVGEPGYRGAAHGH